MIRQNDPNLIDEEEVNPLLKVATTPGSRSSVPLTASANLRFNEKYDVVVDIPLDTSNGSNKKKRTCSLGGRFEMERKWHKMNGKKMT